MRCDSNGHQFSQNNVTVATVGYGQIPKECSSVPLAEQLHQAYAADDLERLKSATGSFAYVIIDSDKKVLIAATDRMGRHPLYYKVENSNLYISSDLQGLDITTPDMDPQGIYNYVYFRMIPSPCSIFQGVHKLPMSHGLYWRDGKPSVKRHWLPTFSETASQSQQDAQQSLRTVLKTAVADCYDAKIPTGAFLSGGLDSSTVTGMLSEIADSQAQAFSIGFSAEGYDEMAYARITANHFGVKLHEYYVTPEDVVNALPKIAAAYDEPFGNSSALPAYFCAQLAASQGVQRLLAGDGGDEIFAGNERYVKQSLFAPYLSLPSGLRTHLIEPVLRSIPDALPLARKAKSYIEQANTPLPDRLQTYNFLHRHSAAEIFNPEFADHLKTELPLAMQRETWNAVSGASELNHMMYFDWQYTLADNDLRKVTHTCELAGVEVMYPMLDDQLLEFSCRLPSQWKIQGNNLRAFYKQALTGWLPDETIHKPKQGFGLPFGVWMETHKPLQDLAYQSLLELKKRHYFRADFLDHAIELHRNQHAAYYGELIWILMVLELWLVSHA